MYKYEHSDVYYVPYFSVGRTATIQKKTKTKKDEKEQTGHSLYFEIICRRTERDPNQIRHNVERVGRHCQKRIQCRQWSQVVCG